MTFTPCGVKTTVTSKYAVVRAQRKLTAAACKQQAGTRTSILATNAPLNLYNDSVSEPHQVFTPFALLNH